MSIYFGLFCLELGCVTKFYSHLQMMRKEYFPDLWLSYHIRSNQKSIFASFHLLYFLYCFSMGGLDCYLFIICLVRGGWAWLGCLVFLVRTSLNYQRRGNNLTIQRRPSKGQVHLAHLIVWRGQVQCAFQKLYLT